jgi:hypothetical protein
MHLARLRENAELNAAGCDRVGNLAEREFLVAGRRG